MGNHDYKRNGNTYTSSITSISAKDFPNVRMLVDPDLVTLSNHKNELCNIALVPFRDRRMYEGKTTKEDSNLYEEEVNRLVLSKDNNGPTILVGHNFFYEGQYTDFSGTEILCDPKNIFNCDAVIMGHYHSFRILSKKDPIAFYTGSMEKVNFSDEEIDKYFMEYDTELKKVKVIKIPTRQLKSVSANLDFIEKDQILETVQSYFKGCQDKIVKVILTVPDYAVPLLKKSTVEKLAYSEGVYYVSKVIIEKSRKKQNKDVDIANINSPSEQFFAYLTKQEVSKEELDIMKTIAKDVFGDP
jgi:DNA repair exonuclease SbcCD nuclease subunit